MSMRVAGINVDENVKALENYIATENVSPPIKKSIEENNEVIEILLERLQRSRPGKKSTEKSKGKSPEDGQEKKERTTRDQLPSERYPNVPVIEKNITLEDLPSCPCCQGQMQDSGMRETSECLTVRPKKYFIYRFQKIKYICKTCHGGIATAPLPPRIVPGSSYGDEMIIDVALSKFCDLLPIERYVQMAARSGVVGLPANSLVNLTHPLAKFLGVIYNKIKIEVLTALILQADETTHKMLEDHDDIKSWYLWGFRSQTACYFLIKNTRAGKIAGDFLDESICRYLVSDVYSGYSKAVSDTNEDRKKKGLALIIHVYCNAHARRYFKDAEDNYLEESRTFIASYKQIYKLEDKVKTSDRDEKLSLRKEMTPYFDEMKRECSKLSSTCSTHSSLGKAIGYFSRNFEGLTQCLKNPDLPLDNNAMERELRSPVVGRKTWYGTHSQRGAKTAAKLFSIVQSCKLNGVNPREYVPHVVDMIHRGEDPPTPHEYISLKKDNDFPPSQAPPE